MDAPADHRRGRLKVFLGMAAGVGKTYRMLLEGHAELEAGRDVVIGLLETHGRAETAQLAEGLPMLPARARAATARPCSRRWTCRAILRARARALPDRRARAHERPGHRARQALRGRRGGPRRRDRRALDAQRPAPRVAQRPHHRAERHPRARDDPRRDPRARRRGRADRPHARGAARAPARRQDLPRRADRRGAQQLLPDREPRRAARGRAAPGRRGGRRQAPDHRAGRLARGEPRRGRRRRPSASACSRWSSPTRAPSGSCAARGARRSGSAPSSICCGCARPGQQLSEENERSLAALRQLASVLGARMLEEESDDLTRGGRRGRLAARHAPTS